MGHGEYQGQVAILLCSRGGGEDFSMSQACQYLDIDIAKICCPGTTDSYILPAIEWNIRCSSKHKASMHMELSLHGLWWLQVGLNAPIWMNLVIDWPAYRKTPGRSLCSAVQRQICQILLKHTVQPDATPVWTQSWTQRYSRTTLENTIIGCRVGEKFVARSGGP